MYIVYIYICIYIYILCNLKKYWFCKLNISLPGHNNTNFLIEPLNIKIYNFNSYGNHKNWCNKKYNKIINMVVKMY